MLSALADEFEREPPATEHFSGNPLDWHRPPLRALADHLQGDE